MSRGSNSELYVPKKPEKTALQLFWEAHDLPPIAELIRYALYGLVGALLVVIVCFISGFRVKETENPDTEVVYTYCGFMLAKEPNLGFMRCSDGTRATVLFGKIRYSDGTVYDGDVKDLMRHGQGTLEYKDGSVYTGGFENDRFAGQGKLVCADGSGYEGSYEKGLYEGQGTLRLAGGGLYVGSFEDGEKSGSGHMIYANSDSFEGTFKKDMRHVGVYTWSSGEKLEGEFENNLPPYYEKMIYTDASGSTYKAYYRYGALEEKQKYAPPSEPETEEDAEGEESENAPVG